MDDSLTLERSSCTCMRAQDKREQRTNLPLRLNAHRLLHLPFVRIEPTIVRVCSQLYKYLKLSSPTPCHESEFVVPDIFSAKILDCPLRRTCTSSNFSPSLKKRKKGRPLMPQYLINALHRGTTTTKGIQRIYNQEKRILQTFLLKPSSCSVTTTIELHKSR